MRRPYLNYGLDEEDVFKQISTSDDGEEPDAEMERAGSTGTLVGDQMLKNFSID